MANEEVKTKLVTKSGKTVIVDSDSLTNASEQEKGVVSQGGSVAKITGIQNVKTALTANAILSSLRNSEVIGNDKFVVLYDPNYTEDFDSDWYYDIYDDVVYTAGQSATVKFEFSDDEVPYRDGYRFKGWALTPNAQTPDYPYDENDPQTYTVTFVDDDITLYAVWELRTCTLTYALGDYGTGSVPAAQTVQEGGEVEVSFSPAPTVNDGSGRVFAGWSTEDGGDEISDVLYSAQSQQTISLYNDVTLYPVFAAQYTLTYALGNDATGTVPSAGTFFDGQTAELNFSPSVTCVSDNTKVFVGWSETDEDTTATYTANGTNSIYMNRNVTLYPVFAAQAQGGSITIVNTSGKGYTVEVYQGETKVLTVAAETQEVFNYTPAEQYEIRSTMSNGTFDGVYNGTQYSNASLQYSSGAVGKFYNPSNSSTTWEFSSGDSGTLTI